MEHLANVTSPNARVYQIRKFVMKPPARGAVLRMITADEDQMLLGEWTRAEAQDNGPLAHEVDALLSEHCQNVEHHVEAVLGWITEEGQGCGSKRLRMRFVRPLEDPSYAPDDEASAIDGTARGLVMQSQQVMQNMTRLYLTAHHGQLAMSMQREAQQHQQLLDAYARIDELQSARIEEAERRHAEVSEAADQLAVATVENDNGRPAAPLTPEEQAQSELHRMAFDVIKQSIPLLLPVLVQKISAMLPSGGTPPAAGGAQVRRLEPRPTRPGGGGVAAAAATAATHAATHAVAEVVAEAVAPTAPAPPAGAVVDIPPLPPKGPAA